ncbi:hypothetical protein ONE63_001949 [Megalurothrips usitatus]|uniref:Uncharacterized protein n=1 Tax=Megalurothrips usitatus TaxID=439358 RepID=A0AAV7XC85_9NEOP|nr:hypothetical protein ONE63_001949 [Megalurothrips usitatus]
MSPLGPQAVSPGDLKALLKQTAGHLSLSELLQNRNLSLSDLLKGNRGALSALTAQHGHANDAAPPSPAAPTASAVPDPDREQSTERHNGFVPSKPRRLPPVIKPTATSTATSAAPAQTTRPRRLPAVVVRAKAEQQHAKAQGTAVVGDALDPMSPAMMAMITLEAADSHTSKPRRIPPAPPTTTPSPSSSTAGRDSDDDTRTTMPPASSTPSATLPPREFYPLNVDSLEITTPRLMGVSKAAPAGSKASWLPPADRIIDAQVFSPGAVTHKFRPHGFVTGEGAGESTAAATAPTTTPPPVPSAPPAPTQGLTTLQNTSDHFRLENETLDLKEGSNALDKRKIGNGPFGRPEQGQAGNATAQAGNGNELDKAQKRKPVTSTSTSTSTSTGVRRLPPTLAGTRRLPAPNPALTRPKATTEAPVRETTPERPRLPFLSVKGRLKEKERERERDRDSLLPPTRFALPLPEVISIEKMIADARSRGALDAVPFSTTPERPSSTDATTTTTTTTTAATTTTTFTSHDEILDLLKSEQSSTRLARILAERNMTLDDLLQHRERGSSQLHFADFFRNASAPTTESVDLVPKEIAPAERKENVNILRSFHEVPKYPFSYSGADDSEEAASTLSLVNVRPAGIVLPADPGERYHRQAPAAAAAAPSRAPRVIPPSPPPSPPPPPPQPYPVPTFRLPDSNPYLVIKHAPVPDRSAPGPSPDAVLLEHVGEIRQVGVSSSVEEAIVVDSNVRDSVRERPSERLDRMTLPSGVKSAIIASTVICGLAIVGFLTIFIVFRWRQKRALIRARGAILCEQLQRGSFRGRSLSPVLVNVSKNSQVQPGGHGGLGGGPVPYYSKKDLNSRATSNTASNRHYYLWRSLRKTFQEDDME